MTEQLYILDKPAARNYINDAQNGVFYNYKGDRISYYKVDNNYIFSLYDNDGNVLKSAVKANLNGLNTAIEEGAYFYKNIDVRKFDRGGLIEDELATDNPILPPKPKPSNNKIAKAVLLSIISDGVIKLKDGQKPYHKKDLLNDFRDMAAASKDFDRFLVKVRNKKDVSPEVSKQFFDIYNKSGNLTPDQAASKLYMQVNEDMRIYNKAPELTNSEKKYVKDNKKEILKVLKIKSFGDLDILSDYDKTIRDAIEKHKKQTKLFNKSDLEVLEYINKKQKSKPNSKLIIFGADANDIKAMINQDDKANRFSFNRWEKTEKALDKITEIVSKEKTKKNQPTGLLKFKPGRKYEMRWIGDADLKTIYKVISRTDKFIAIQQDGKKKIKKVKVEIYDNSEQVHPTGKYSMSPVLRAEKLVEEKNKPTEIVYFTEPSGNKITLLTKVQLTGSGIKKISNNGIITHKNVIHKNLNDYRVTGNAFEKIKEIYHIEQVFP